MLPLAILGGNMTDDLSVFFFLFCFISFLAGHILHGNLKKIPINDILMENKSTIDIKYYFLS